MGKNSENFKQSLSEMKKFLTSRQQLSNLANKCKVSLRTVYNTFESESFEDLKGKQIEVYRTAIELVNEIKSLPNQAAEALK